MAEDRVLDLDRRDVLTAGDDHVLLTIRDGEVVVVVVDRAAVAGVEPLEPIIDDVDRGGGLVRLIPVAVHHHVAAGEHLVLPGDRGRDPDRRRPCPAQPLSPGGRRECVELGPAAVDCQEWRGLSQAVDLDELPAEFGLDPLDRSSRRGRTGHDDAHLGAPGNLALPILGCIEHHREHGRRTAHQRHTVALDATEDLRAVDFAEDDVLAAHTCDGVGHAPTVAVELGQGVEIDVAVVDPEVPAERGGVDPQVAVGELNALGPGRRAARVVDRRGCILVGNPSLRLCVEAHQFTVGIGADDQRAFAFHARQRIGEFWVHEQDAGAGVIDDELDLLRNEAEVDRDEHSPRTADAEERREETGRVVAHHCNPLARCDAQRIETGSLRGGAARHLAIRRAAPTRRRLVRLIDEADPIWIDLAGSAEEIVDRQCNLHSGPSLVNNRAITYSAVAPVRAMPGPTR